MLTTAEQAKAVVKERYEGRIVGEDNRKSTAYAINVIKRDALSGERFITEILQNADDACQMAQVDSGEITFVLTSNYLICSYNGKPFEKNDVLRLSEVGDPDGDKVSNSHQIGNKGVGFKSLFTITPYVLIYSYPYTFRFDRHYEVWANDNRHWPWEITPIWTEESEIPQEVHQSFTRDKVSIVLKIEPEHKKSVEDALKKLMLNAHSLIFLRKISNVTFIDSEQKKQVIEKRVHSKIDVANHGAVNTYDEIIDGVVSAQWFVHYYRLNTPDALKNEGLASDTLIERNKQILREGIPVSLAFRIKNNQTSVENMPKVYCYLPTTINWPFKMLIQSEFLLDIGRTQLNADGFARKWNSFILENVFRIQFYFLHCIAISDSKLLWKLVTRLITHPDTISWGDLANQKEVFKKAFTEQLNNVSFLRNIPTNQILFIKNLKFDRYGFVAAFGDDDLKRTCINSEIEDIEFLISQGLAEFTVSDIINILKSPKFLSVISQKSSNIAIIKFLNKLYLQLKHTSKNQDITSLNGYIKNNAFILNCHGEIKKPTEIFFPVNSLKYFYEQHKFMSMFSEETLAELSDQMAWLKELQIVDVTLEIIIEEANKNTETLVSLTKMFFDCHQRNILNEADYESLKSLKLKTTLGVYCEADKCYLPERLSPQIALERVIPDHHFIADDYWRENDQREAWKIFFIKIGVAQTIVAENIETIIANANKNEALLIIAAQVLFRAFQSSNELQHKITTVKTKLKLLGSNGTYYSSEELYLPDSLNPDFRFEENNIDVRILSPVYIENCGDKQKKEWRKFLLALGVSATIKITSFENLTFAMIYKLPLGEEYYKACEAQYTDNKCSRYVNIAYIEKIIFTPFFWQVLAKNWGLIKNYLSVTGCNKWGAAFTLTPNIKFLTRKAIAHSYPEKTPQDLFSPSLHDIEKLGKLASFLPIAEVVKLLDDEQLAVLGFKVKLSLDECVDLLIKISEKETCEERIAITYIYETIIFHLNQSSCSPLENDKRPSIKLLNQIGTFISLDEGFAMVDANEMTQSSPKLLFKPAKINSGDFKKLCDYFGIKTFSKADVAINPKNAKQSALQTILKKVLSIILIFEYRRKDFSFESASAYLIERGKELLSKLSKIKIIVADSITVGFQDIYSENVEYFKSEELTTIYHIDQVDFSVLRQLYDEIYNYFSISFDIDIFIRILSISFDDLLAKYNFLKSNEINAIEKILDNLMEESKSNSSVKRSRSVESEEENDDDARHPRKIAKTENAVDKSASKDTDLSMKGVTVDIQTLASSSRSTGYSDSCFRYSFSSDRFQKPENTSTETQAGTDVVESEHAELMNIEQIDLNSVTISTQNFTSSKKDFCSNPTENTSTLNEEQRKKIGRLGEKIVYEKLKQDYIKKYPHTTFIETEKGFMLKGRGTIGKEKNDGDLSLEVIWHNKDKPDSEDAGTPQDFTIIKNGVARHIEVKSTPSALKANFHISSRENDVMREYGNHYRIFRVFNVGKSMSPAITKIKDPAEKVNQGYIKVTSFTMQF